VSDKKIDFKLKVYKTFKNLVNVNTRAFQYILNDCSMDIDDLVHDLWVDFFSRGYDKKFDSKKSSLKTYLFRFMYMYLSLKERNISKITFQNVENIDNFESDEISAEKFVILKEIENFLEKNNYGGIENEIFVKNGRGSQTSYGKEINITRQGVNYRVNQQKNKLKKLYDQFFLFKAPNG